MFGSQQEATEATEGFDLSRTIRRIVVLGFALIQAALVARILLDLGVIPADSSFSDPIVRASEALTGPVQGIGNQLPFGIGAAMMGVGSGGGFNVSIVAALAGWTVVEALVMRVVRKFDQI